LFLRDKLPSNRTRNSLNSFGGTVLFLVQPHTFVMEGSGLGVCFAYGATLPVNSWLFCRGPFPSRTSGLVVTLFYAAWFSGHSFGGGSAELGDLGSVDIPSGVALQNFRRRSHGVGSISVVNLSLSHPDLMVGGVPRGWLSTICYLVISDYGGAP
jgi:hypothetical protein